MYFVVGMAEQVVSHIEDTWYCDEHDKTGVRFRRFCDGSRKKSGERVVLPVQNLSCNIDWRHAKGVDEPYSERYYLVHFVFRGRVVFARAPRRDCLCSHPRFLEESHLVELLLPSVLFFKLREKMSVTAHCPDEGPDCSSSTLWDLILHLNDEHRWDRDMIADWVDETAREMKLDLSIPLPEEIPPEPGERKIS